MKLDLKDNQRQVILDILTQYLPDYEIWAFGSRVDGTAKPFSDLDLVVKSTEPVPSDLFSNAIDAFDASNLPIKVDLVDWSRISDRFQQIILENYIVI